MSISLQPSTFRVILSWVPTLSISRFLIMHKVALPGGTAELAIQNSRIIPTLWPPHSNSGKWRFIARDFLLKLGNNLCGDWHTGRGPYPNYTGDFCLKVPLMDLEGIKIGESRWDVCKWGPTWTHQNPYMEIWFLMGNQWKNRAAYFKHTHLLG